MTMIKYIFVCFVICLTAACDSSSKEIKYEVLPDELKDCKFYVVNDRRLATLYIVKCPTSTNIKMRNGKINKNIVLIE